MASHSSYPEASSSPSPTEWSSCLESWTLLVRFAGQRDIARSPLQRHQTLIVNESVPMPNSPSKCWIEAVYAAAAQPMMDWTQVCASTIRSVTTTESFSSNEVRNAVSADRARSETTHALHMEIQTDKHPLQQNSCEKKTNVVDTRWM